jgi:hypothetical protein
MNETKSASRMECLRLAVKMAYYMVRRMWRPANLRKKHWLLCGKPFLSKRLLEEVRELDKSLFAFDGEPTPWEEAADVANFAAMLASRAALAAEEET